jgi:hypothetical protein
MDGIDLSSWIGRPPQKSAVPEEPEESEDDAMEDHEAEVAEDHPDDDPEGETFAPEELSPATSSDKGDIIHDDGMSRLRATKSSTRNGDESADDDGEDEDEVNGQAPAPSLFQKHFYIDVPVMTEEEKEQYVYLPGHFAVERVLARGKDKRCNVLLQSGERSIVCPPFFQFIHIASLRVVTASLRGRFVISFIQFHLIPSS